MSSRPREGPLTGLAHTRSCPRVAPSARLVVQHGARLLELLGWRSLLMESGAAGVEIVADGEWSCWGGDRC